MWEKRKMATPTKEQIYQKALELWRTDQIKHGCVEALELTPEPSELLESGYVWLAQQQLMKSTDAYAEWLEKEYMEVSRKPKVEFAKLKTQPFTVDIEEALRSGIFISGTSQCGKSTLGMQIAKELINNGVSLLIFDSSQAWFRFKRIDRIISVLPNASYEWRDYENVLFDLSRLTPFEIQKFTELCSKEIMHVAFSRNQRTKIMVIFEECHIAMPNHALYSKRYAETVRLLTIGGNVNVRFVAITQFASMCDKLLVKMAQQRYFGKTSESNDIKYIRSVIGEHVKELPNLQRGEFVYSYGSTIAKIKVEPEQTKNTAFTYTYNFQL
jgi:hypothetical protein